MRFFQGTFMSESVEASDIVLEIMERGGKAYVAFQKHAAYYELPDDPAARQAALDSRDRQQEVSFAFNRKAQITQFNHKPVAAVAAPKR